MAEAAYRRRQSSGHLFFGSYETVINSKRAWELCVKQAQEQSNFASLRSARWPSIGDISERQIKAILLTVYMEVATDWGVIPIDQIRF